MDCGDQCKTYSLSKPQEGSGSIYGQPILNWTRDRFDETADCVKMESCCDQRKINCLQKAHDRWWKTEYSTILPPIDNSNTYASCILHRCHMPRSNSYKCGVGWQPGYTSFCQNHWGEYR
jgi:hypothetical protein